MELSPRFVERLIFGFGPQRRRTQDSPVLPDVWAFYATPSEDVHRREGREAARLDAAAEAPPERPLELLLTPHRKSSPATLATELRQRLADAREECGDRDRAKPRIAYTQSYVVARLPFTLHLTYDPQDFKPHKGHDFPKAELAALLAEARQAGHDFTVRHPAAGEESVVVDLEA